VPFNVSRLDTIFILCRFVSPTKASKTD